MHRAPDLREISVPETKPATEWILGDTTRGALALARTPMLFAN